MNLMTFVVSICTVVYITHRKETIATNIKDLFNILFFA